MVGEVETIEVGKRLLDLRATVRMLAQIIVDLFIWVGMRQFDGIQVTTEVGRTSSRGTDFRPHGGGADGQAAALAGAGHPDAGRIDLRARQEKIDAAPGIDVEAAIGIGMPIDDVMGQEIGIAGIELSHAAQLATRRHRQRDIALAGPFFGNGRIHLIARQEQDRWAALCPAAGSAIPGGDPHLIEAIVKYLEHLDVIRRAQGVWNHFRSEWDGLHLT